MLLRWGKKMNFRRKESFRFIFNEPIGAEFTVYVNGKPLNDNSYSCKIHDVSPRGMKLFSDEKIDLDFQQNIQFKVHFVLDTQNISALGDVVWCKPYFTGKQYGLAFHEQSDIEELIINEMKNRRRKEVFGNENR